jgi:hypothetical protein
MQALIMKVNKPRDKILMGNVKITRIGLIIVFRIPKIAAAIIKSPGREKLIPATISSAVPKATAFTNHRIIAFRNISN